LLLHAILSGLVRAEQIHNPKYAQEFWKMINDAFEAA
jgi:hypothetical protein